MSPSTVSRGNEENGRDVNLKRSLMSLDDIPGILLGDPSSSIPRCEKSCRTSSIAGSSIGSGRLNELPLALPSMKKVAGERAMYEGPTDESNWVIPGHLLVGAYPSEVDDNEHKVVLGSILDCGVTTFVCLQKEYDHKARDRKAWINQTKIRPYIDDAYALCKLAHSKGNGTEKCRPDELSFLHVPITDCDCTLDSTVLKLAEAVCWRLLAGEVVYVHCWGGHGRSGTVVAVILGLLYKSAKADILKRTQLYHDMRRFPLQVPSPQTFDQKMQVLRILDEVSEREAMVNMHRDDPTRCFSHRDDGREFELPISSTGSSLRLTTEEEEDDEKTQPEYCIKRQRVKKEGGDAHVLRPLVAPRCASGDLKVIL